MGTVRNEVSSRLAFIFKLLVPNQRLRPNRGRCMLPRAVSRSIKPLPLLSFSKTYSSPPRSCRKRLPNRGLCIVPSALSNSFMYPPARFQSSNETERFAMRFSSRSSFADVPSLKRATTKRQAKTVYKYLFPVMIMITDE